MYNTTATTNFTTSQTNASVISAYNRGPITSVFAPPASCTQTLTLNPINGNELFFGHEDQSYANLDCYPTGTREVENLASLEEWRSYYYSPAICPQSWTTALNFTSTWFASDSNFPVDLGSATTAALCCPSEYSYHKFGHQCISGITEGQSVVYRSPAWLGKSYDLGTRVTTSIFQKSTFAFGEGVPIWWQSSDEAALSSASSRLPTPSSAVQTIGPTPASSGTAITPTITLTPAPNKPGFPTGAKIGLGLGVPLVVFAGLALGWFVFRRRKSKGRFSPTDDRYGGNLPEYRKPGHIYELQGVIHVHELPNIPIQELDTGPRQYYSTHELPEAR